MEQKYRQIQIDGLVPFARGGMGECYRLDEDTILKLYREGFSDEWIDREKTAARAAFVAGIPTAISFYTVQSGNRKGIIYEHISGRTVSEMISVDPSKVNEYGRQCGKLLKDLHSAKPENVNLPDATECLRESVDRMYTDAEDVKKRIMSCVDMFVDGHHFVHGDAHPNNVMVSSEGLMLIDMANFALGSPLIDLGVISFHFFSSPASKSEGRSPITGLLPDEATAFWNSLIKEYSPGGLDKETNKKLDLMVMLMRLFLVSNFGDKIPGEYCDKTRQDIQDMFG